MRYTAFFTYGPIASSYRGLAFKEAREAPRDLAHFRKMAHYDKAHHFPPRLPGLNASVPGTCRARQAISGFDSPRFDSPEDALRSFKGST